MSASLAMTVSLSVLVAGMARCAGGRIPAAHVQSMVVHVVTVRLMQMAVVQVIDVPVVHDCGMAAIVAMCVRMSFVSLMICRHPNSPCAALTQQVYRQGGEQTSTNGRMPAMSRERVTTSGNDAKHRRITGFQRYVAPRVACLRAEMAFHWDKENQTQLQLDTVYPCPHLGRLPAEAWAGSSTHKSSLESTTRSRRRAQARTK